MALNKQQEEAANYHNGPVLVTACPGSGKTTVIKERTDRLIKNGADPLSILLITFTNKACKEMRERISKHIGDASSKIGIYTFHGFCARLIRRSGNALGYTGEVSIFDDKDQEDLIGSVSRQMEIELTKPMIKRIAWAVNESRDNLESDDDMYDRFRNIDEKFYDIAKEYLKKLKESNAVDFSGLIYESINLLENHPDVLEKVHKRIKYIMIDECQDTSISQYKLAKILSSHSHNIFMTGDIDQSIYSWRSARPENINDFLNHFKNTKIIRLGKNYRSTPEIVRHADLLIKNNPNRLSDEFSTDNPSGPPVVVKSFINQDYEAKYIAEKCKELILGGIKPSEISVLYRLNSMSRAVELAMMSNSIPYVVKGSFSFFDRKEIRDIICMLRFLVNPKDGIAFQRFANKPSRGLGDVTIGKIEKIAESNNIDILQACYNTNFKNQSIRDGLDEISNAFAIDYKTKSIPEVITHLYESLRYEEYLKEDEDDFEERKENINELINDSIRFVSENGNNLVGYIEALSLISSTDDSKDEEKSVKLMSAHSSKGLEWDNVFIIGAEQGVFPHSKAIKERDNGIEEERRLFFVAMTRCRKNLCISLCQKRINSFAAKSEKFSYKESEPSQFLVEAGLIKPIAKKIVKKVYVDDENW